MPSGPASSRGELIFKGYDNETMADIVEVTTRTVNNWRRLLHERTDHLLALVRKQGSGRTLRGASATPNFFLMRCATILDVHRSAGYPAAKAPSKWLKAGVMEAGALSFLILARRKVE